MKAKGQKVITHKPDYLKDYKGPMGTENMDERDLIHPLQEPDRAAEERPAPLPSWNCRNDEMRFKLLIWTMDMLDIYEDWPIDEEWYKLSKEPIKNAIKESDFDRLVLLTEQPEARRYAFWLILAKHNKGSIPGEPRKYTEDEWQRLRMASLAEEFIRKTLWPYYYPNEKHPRTEAPTAKFIACKRWGVRKAKLDGYNHNKKSRPAPKYKLVFRPGKLFRVDEKGRVFATLVGKDRKSVKNKDVRSKKAPGQ
jgi:hypothetical protein